MATAYQEGSKLLSKIWNFASGKATSGTGPTLRGAAADSVEDTAARVVREAMQAERSSSRRGIALRPTATRSDLVDAAKERLSEEGIELTQTQIARMTRDIARDVERGGFGKRTAKTMLTAAAAKPILATSVVGGGGYLAYNHFANGTGSAGPGGDGFSPGIMTGMFNGASEGLQYLGMDPTWAHVITALGTFWAINASLNTVMKSGLAMSGLDKVIPSGLVNIAGLGIMVGAGYLAMTTAASAGNTPETPDPSRHQIQPPAAIMAPTL